MRYVAPFVALLFISCSSDSPVSPDPARMREVETAVAAFADGLTRALPPDAEVGDRVAAYLERNPAYFHGATISVLNADGTVRISPYWYRSGTSLAFSDLAVSSYRIQTREWFTKPISTKRASWTEPYFDAGGSEIWIRTYSVPIMSGGNVVGVVATDLAVTR